MKSNIDSQYLKTENPDGSISVHFKSSLSGASLLTLIFFLSFLIFVVLSMIGAGLESLGVRINTKGDFWTYVVLIGFGVAVVLSFYLHTYRHDWITVLAKQGLKHKNKQIAFSDIKSIGTVKTGGGLAYIHVEALGQKVKVSGYMDESVATAVNNEIQSISGINWR